MGNENSEPPTDSALHQKRESIPLPPSSPTRILLRLPVKMWEYGHSYRAAIEAYLSWANLPVQDYSDWKHNIFLEPLQPRDVPQKRFHVAIDLYALSYDVKDMKDVEHKIYAVLRDPEGNM